MSFLWFFNPLAFKYSIVKELLLVGSLFIIFRNNKTLINKVLKGFIIDHL
jgi:hypothetical protein